MISNLLCMFVFSIIRFIFDVDNRTFLLFLDVNIGMLCIHVKDARSFLQSYSAKQAGSLLYYFNSKEIKTELSYA
jgi:hypothetical protein